VVSIAPSQDPMVIRGALPLNSDNSQNFEIVDVDYQFKSSSSSCPVSQYKLVTKTSSGYVDFTSSNLVLIENTDKTQLKLHLFTNLPFDSLSSQVYIEATTNAKISF
jgi:hypothetical protein